VRHGDGWTLYKADVMGWAAAYDGAPFHAMLCDPPYHLSAPRTHTSFVGGTKDRPLTEGAKEQRRQSGGFMGKRWDGGSIAHDPETWAALAAHLLPGAFLMCFASSRGWHRQAVAMEDAGLIAHPSVFMLGWATGQGFPKASRIDRAIDDAAGATG
jgi:site-specific DNA-methyltransferase (adenine-specific)